MKKLFFGLIATVMFGFVGNSQSLLKIGIVKDGNFLITEDIGSVKEVWRTFLSNQKIDGVIENYEIKSNVDVELKNEVYYYIFGSSKEKDLKIVCQLVLDKDVFYIDLESMAPGTVTCSGCASACDPYKHGGHWWCSLGCGIGGCTKTTTVHTEISTN